MSAKIIVGDLKNVEKKGFRFSDSDEGWFAQQEDPEAALRKAHAGSVPPEAVLEKQHHGWPPNYTDYTFTWYEITL